jgi:hypothetical protein
MLIDIEDNRVVAGGRFNMSIEDIEGWLNEEDQVTREREVS